MAKSWSVAFRGLVLATMAVSAAACTPPITAIEVLPPRAAPECAPADAAAAPMARGILDVQALDVHHGSYRADVRVTARDGAVDVLDSFHLEYALPNGLDQATVDEAEARSGRRAMGDARLVSMGDGTSQVIIQNVELLPRDLVRAFRADSKLELAANSFFTATVKMRVVSGTNALESESSFPIEICDGCLLSEEALQARCSSDQVSPAASCRPGQDTPSFVCRGVETEPGGGGGFNIGDLFP